jgi:hypothetical protein
MTPTASSRAIEEVLATRFDPKTKLYTFPDGTETPYRDTAINKVREDYESMKKLSAVIMPPR